MAVKFNQPIAQQAAPKENFVFMMKRFAGFYHSPANKGLFRGRKEIPRPWKKPELKNFN
jgi:hypothetical protein